MIGFASLFSAPEVTPSYGEPEWMPSPAEVARARADMERRGIVQSVTRDLAGTQMVPAGETPWPWLIGAALWIAIWPAVIALALQHGPARPGCRGGWPSCCRRSICWCRQVRC